LEQYPLLGANERVQLQENAANKKELAYEFGDRQQSIVVRYLEEKPSVSQQMLVKGRICQYLAYSALRSQEWGK
jgi:hypothetical protein